MLVKQTLSPGRNREPKAARKDCEVVRIRGNLPFPVLGAGGECGGSQDSGPPCSVVEHSLPPCAQQPPLLWTVRGSS